MLVVCCMTRVINRKIVEDEAIYNPQRFLVENFFLLVIKPPGAYFNYELLPSCRSSKFSPSFHATSVLWFRWIQFVLIEILGETAKCFNFSQTIIALKVSNSRYISY